MLIYKIDKAIPHCSDEELIKYVKNVSSDARRYLMGHLRPAVEYLRKSLKWPTAAYDFIQKSTFCSKIDILVKNRHFGQKSTFSSKIDILLKNRHFGQKSTFYSKIDILLKNRPFVQKSTFCLKIDLLLKNRHFAQKLEILVKNRYFD